MTTTQLYNLLINKGIKSSKGRIDFSFLEHKVKVTAKSSVGYVFQDWLESWMKNEQITSHKKTNSQEWPDFYLEPDANNTKGLVELKTFDFDEGPNFDIANFDAYCRSLKAYAYRLDADYLIFCYRLNNKGLFTIADIWLKKVWEISSPSKKWPIRCQVKQGIIHNIRPAKWYSAHLQNQCFKTRLKFVEAISKTLLQYPTRANESGKWLKEVMANYKLYTGKNL